MRNHARILLCFSVIGIYCTLLSQHPNRINLSGTRISIIPPKDYFSPQSSTLLISAANDAALLVKEVPSSFEELVGDFTSEENLVQRGLTKISTPQEISIDGWKGVKINFSQRQGLLTQVQIITQVFIAGDTTESVFITVSYADTLQMKKRDELVACVQTIKWDRSRKLNVMELNNFSVVPAGDFRLYKSDGESGIFTLEGSKIDSTKENPFMILQLYNRPFSDMMPDQQTERMMESIVLNFFPLIKNISAVEFLKDTIDGLRTFETVFMGQHIKNDSSRSLFLTLLLHPAKNIALIGYSGSHYHDSLIKIFKETIHTFKRNRIDVQEHKECYQFLSEKKFKQASECYKIADQNSTTSLSARLGYAEALRFLGKHEQAIKTYESVIQRNEISEEAYLGIARSCSSLKKYYEAEKAYDKVISLNIVNAQAYFERSKIKQNYGNTDGAVKDLDKAVRLDPNSIEIHLARAQAKAVVYEYNDAFASYKKVLEVDEKNGTAYLRRGELYAKKRLYKEALQDLNTAQKYSSDRTTLYKLRGEVLLNKREYVEAVNAFNLHLRYNKKDKSVLVLRGCAQGYSGKHQNAMEDFSDVLNTDDDNADAFFYRGVFRFFKGKVKDAANDIRSSLRSALDSEKRVWLFVAEAKSYNYTAARKNLRSYFDAIQGQQLQEMQLAIRYALLEINEEQYLSEVNKLARNENSIIQNNALCNAYFTIGLLAFTSGQKIGAKKYFQKCVNCNAEGNPNFLIADAYVNGNLQ